MVQSRDIQAEAVATERVQQSDRSHRPGQTPGYRPQSGLERLEQTRAISGQEALRTIEFRRRLLSEPPPELPEQYHRQYREVVQYIGKAFVAAVPPRLLSHFVRATVLLDRFGDSLDHAATDLERMAMLGPYIELVNRLALVSQRMNLTHAAAMLQFAGVREEGATIDQHPEQAGDWREAVERLQ